MRAEENLEWKHSKFTPICIEFSRSRMNDKSWGVIHTYIPGRTMILWNMGEIWNTFDVGFKISPMYLTNKWFLILTLSTLLDCDVTWASWHLKSPPTRLLVQQLVQTNNKENIIARITGLWRGESTGHRRNFRYQGPMIRKACPWHNVTMSCDARNRKSKWMITLNLGHTLGQFPKIYLH